MIAEYFNFGNSQNILLWTVISVMFVSFGIQLYYYLVIFRRVGSKKRKGSSKHSTPPVSVIICARNESANLSKILPLALEQNYPQYEVVVVNDNSSDESDQVLSVAQKHYPHLVVRNLIVNNAGHGKSIVLGVGIKAAKYSRLIIIDVNCRPSREWIRSISSGFDAGGIVVSYARYKAAGKVVRTANYCESLFRLGYALNKKPYSASGENEGFEKELFFEKGFNPFLRKLEKVEQVFFNSIMTKNNTTVVLLPEAIVDSENDPSFNEWCMECSGELFARRLFRKGTRHVKLPEIVFRMLFYLSVAAAIYLTVDVIWMWTSIAGIFALRLIVQIAVFVSTQRVLGEKKLLFHAILWDLYSIVVYLYIFSLTKHRKAIRWQ
jgi:glycosyltransferase involved in cell wall biosynthesis